MKTGNVIVRVGLRFTFVGKCAKQAVPLRPSHNRSPKSGIVWSYVSRKKRRENSASASSEWRLTWGTFSQSSARPMASEAFFRASSDRQPDQSGHRPANTDNMSHLTKHADMTEELAGTSIQRPGNDKHTSC